MSTSPTAHDVAAVCPTRSSAPTPVVRSTHGTSSAWTCTGTCTCSSSALMPSMRPAAHRAPEMVRVEVGGRARPVSRMPSAARISSRSCDGIGRVDHERLARRAVADEVDEVDHLARHHVPVCEVAARQELAEVEAVVGPGQRARHPSSSSPCRSRLGRRAAAVAAHRLEARHQLLDLGAGPAQPPVELVNEHAWLARAASPDVDVDLALLEEVDDRIELAAGVGVAQLADRHGAAAWPSRRRRTKRQRHVTRRRPLPLVDSRGPNPFLPPCPSPPPTPPCCARDRRRTLSRPAPDATSPALRTS